MNSFFNVWCSSTEVVHFVWTCVLLLLFSPVAKMVPVWSGVFCHCTVCNSDHYHCRRGSNFGEKQISSLMHLFQTCTDTLTNLLLFNKYQLFVHVCGVCVCMCVCVYFCSMSNSF